MDLLAGWHSSSVILAKKNVYVIPVLSLFRQRLYQIIAGYEDTNDADRLRHDPVFQILGDQPLVNLSDPNQLSAAGRTPPAPRDLLELPKMLYWIGLSKICGKQVRKRGEILLDVDSTTIPHSRAAAASFFNGGYDQHMYHPLLIFERHTGCLLAARLRPGRVVSARPHHPLAVAHCSATPA